MSAQPDTKLAALRVGIDLGGTKIAGVAMGDSNRLLAERRERAPRGDYDATVRAIGGMVAWLEAQAGARGTVGVGIPGSIAPASGLVQNANSTWLNGRPLRPDLESHLGRAVRVANDANCFALSEAVDGAGAGARAVFGVIVGTGCGGGLVFDGHLVEGARGIGSEWGHNPLPWASPEEYPGPACWCGRRGCMETWVSGPALEGDYAAASGNRLAAEDIAARAQAGDALAQAALARHANRLGRGLAHVINIFDADVIVLGGGLSQLQHLYRVLPALVASHLFGSGLAASDVTIRPPRWGDASGVRGAAWLWGRP
jgi:fructokinase